MPETRQILGLDLKEAEIFLNTCFIRVYRPYPYPLVGGLEEVWVEGKKDSNNWVFSTGILREGHRKVPIGKASGEF